MNWTSLLSFVRSQDLKYQVVVFFMLFMLATSMALIVFVFWHRYWRSRKQRMRTWVKTQLEPFFQELILSGEDDPFTLQKELKKIETLIPSGYEKYSESACRAILFELEQLYVGETKNTIKTIYSMLQLDKHAIETLKSGSAEEKAGALAELRRMDMKRWLFEILPYTNHPFYLIRREAQLAAIALGGWKGLDFLNDLSVPITEWQIQRMVIRIARLPITKHSDKSGWFASSNPSVRILAMRLARHYQWTDLHPLVTANLDHPDREVQTEALHCLGQWNFPFPVMEVIERVFNYSPPVQKTALHYLAQFASDEESLLLEPLLYHHERTTVRYTERFFIQKFGAQHLASLRLNQPLHGSI